MRRWEPPESGVAAASRAFERAVRVHGFVHYREASAWARGVDDAIDNISRLLEDGQAAAVVELCESALRNLVGASGAIDDSDGHLGVLRDRLHDIHFRACQEAKPDPVALARRLLEWELHSELDVFYGAAEHYGNPPRLRRTRCSRGCTGFSSCCSIGRTTTSTTSSWGGASAAFRIPTTPSANEGARRWIRDLAGQFAAAGIAASFAFSVEVYRPPAEMAARYWAAADLVQ